MNHSCHICSIGFAIFPLLPINSSDNVFTAFRTMALRTSAGKEAIFLSLKKGLTDLAAKLIIDFDVVELWYIGFLSGFGGVYDEISKEL